MKSRIVVTEEEVARRVAELGEEISRFYEGREFTVVALGNGAVFFAVDLCRNLRGSFYFDYASVSSYCNNASSGEVTLRCPPKNGFAGREVLLVDDVLDTGRTLSRMRQWFLEQGAASVRCAVLTEKEGCLCPQAEGFRVEWCGFKMPPLYLIGCGMDVDEYQRQLPFIAVLEN